MPEKIKKGARYEYEVSQKQANELVRKLDKQPHARGIPGAMESGWMPDFYAYGEGAFARQFDGMRPMHIAQELEPYYEGDIMELTGMVTPFEKFYFSPFDVDFNEKHNAARRRYEIAKKSAIIAEGRGGYYGKKFGLKPMTRKRATPFTVPKDAVVRGVGPDDDGGVDVG